MSVTTRTCYLHILMLALWPGLVLAAPAQWQSVANQAGSTVELDKSRITRLATGKTAAWTQLTLDHAILDFESQIRYTSVQALNHYDCTQGSFSTQQRIYLLDGRAIKREKVSGAPVPVKPDSLDARVLDTVCKPRNGDEMQQIARQAAAAATAAHEKRARPMHAEMVSNAEAVMPRTMKVADTAPAAAPPAPAAAAPIAPATEKPRYIQMPLIDKSKAEDPFKNAAPAATSSPSNSASPSPAPKPAASAPIPAPPAVSAPPAAARPVPVPKAGAVTVMPTPELSRQQRELMLATSGPRKATRKKEESAPDYTKVEWGYAGLGAPENWAKLKPGFAACDSGKRQSPIDIRGGVKVDLEPIRFDYRNTQFRVIDTGKTLQVDVAEGSSITITGRNYPLSHILFHRPAEERINGKGFDMAMHLVHKDFDNSTAIVAVLLERGSEHPVVQTLWNYIPLEVGMENAPPNVSIDLSRLLPERREYFTYMGSLTTPPCTENVLWMIMKNPLQVSSQQIGIFSRLYPHNARPLQSVNDRLIKESR